MKTYREFCNSLSPLLLEPPKFNNISAYLIIKLPLIAIIVDDTITIFLENDGKNSSTTCPAEAINNISYILYLQVDFEWEQEFA